ncbi:hypothetical protein NLG97_g7490 [Lecanicillium saksenae]|uniref:Uncharacterized protein n=1 Tax=Lecanicillium saksenae TaxID=468837 RepID=A0ACC1QM89_9HYPO|nr:hypothetical protein NLG97_g7490 [Lecanicillium saksenae]
MVPSLNALSVELVDCVTSYLDFADISALRQASRAINSAVLATRYPRYFKTKGRLWLDTPSLQSFAALANTSELVCSLEALTLVSVLNPPSAEPDETSLHRSLLAEAFMLIKRRSKTGSLLSLTLSIAPRLEGTVLRSKYEKYYEAVARDWKHVWNLADEALATTMYALGESSLPVSQLLDLFSGIRGCSLYFHKFADIPARFPLALASLDGLKALKVSLSPPMKLSLQRLAPGETRLFTDDGQHVPHSGNVLEDTRRLLPVLTPSLESLDMHWYDLDDRSLETSALLLPDNSDAAIHGMPLKSCRLRGFKVGDVQLRDFLEKLRPASIELQHVGMVRGSWDTVLRYICSAESGIESFCLDDLLDADMQLLHFDAPGRPKFPYLGRGGGPNTLVRAGSDANQSVRYFTMTVRALGSPEVMRWKRDSLQNYGSRSGGYHFLVMNSLPRAVELDEEEPDPDEVCSGSGDDDSDSNEET